MESQNIIAVGYEVPTQKIKEAILKEKPQFFDKETNKFTENDLESTVKSGVFYSKSARVD